MNIPHRSIHRILRDEGLAEAQPKKSRRRKWVRYERTCSNSMWHTDWKQIHGGTHDERWFLCHGDDASRFVTGYGMFDDATAENALKVPDEAIARHGRPAPVMTDHGSQFYANQKKEAERGASRFGKRLVELGIRQILAGVNHPQTNGKLERLHGEIQRKLHEFEDVAGPPGSGCPIGCEKIESDPVYRFMKWYNQDRPHMSLDWDNQETPVQAFTRKMPKEGKTVIDGQAGEEFNAK